MATFFSFWDIDAKHEAVYYRQRLDFVSLMSVKEKLKNNKVLDPVLCANLNHAVVTLSQVHPSRLDQATLLVFGDSLMVKICTQLDKVTAMHFLVATVDGRPQFHQEVICDEISLGDIKQSHFLGHRCQDQKKSCLEQAREALSQGTEVKQLRIVCNKLFLTYTAENEGNTVDPDADIITIKTQCNLVPSLRGFGGLLQAKCWLEQEKPENRGLLACIHYLLKNIASETTCIESNFVLQNEGEMVTILCNWGSNKVYALCCSSEGVTMLPPSYEFNCTSVHSNDFPI